jgi:hypothetical protein
VIKEGAFGGCSNLTTAILGVGLEEIGERAFRNTSLVRIDIPPSVRVIKEGAFGGCSNLTTAILGVGLEEIGEWAFSNTSLVRIDIPPAVRTIKEGAFRYYLELTTVILGDGLEEIGKWAFYDTSLVRINIPPAVRTIDETAFERCSELTTITFCNEIEEFVSGESMQGWWNNGIHAKCLSTYCFFVRCNIPERLGLVSPRKWRSDIHDRLRRIPSISPKGLDSNFHSIDSKLSVYNELKDAPALLDQKLTNQLTGPST